MPTPQQVVSTVTELPVWSVDNNGNTVQDGWSAVKVNSAPTAVPTGYVAAYSPDGAQVVTVDPVGTVRGLSLQYVDAPQDQSTSSASQVASTYLFLPVAANAKYKMEAAIIAQNTTGIFTPSWTGPSGATMKWNDTTSSLDYGATIGATNNTFAANAGVRMILLEGRLKTAGTAGSLTFTFSASAGTSTVFTDSYLTLARVG